MFTIFQLFSLSLMLSLEPVHHLPVKPDFTITVEKAVGTKCDRCWNYRPAVGTYADHPTLCDRCIEPVRKILNEAVR